MNDSTLNLRIMERDNTAHSAFDALKNNIPEDTGEIKILEAILSLPFEKREAWLTAFTVTMEFTSKLKIAQARKQYEARMNEIYGGELKQASGYY